jgi:hypothetical protein
MSHLDVNAVPPAVVGVWSSAYSTNNITVPGPSLGPGSQLIVDINVSNAPKFNSFEFALFYDPTYITVVSYDLTTGTMFPDPFVAIYSNTTQQTPPPHTTNVGAFRISVANLGNVNFQGSGTLVHITFRVKAFGASPLALAAVSPDVSGSATSPVGGKPNWTRLIVSTQSSTNYVETPITTSDGYFRNVAGPQNLPPIALFTWTPIRPAQMKSVSFNASASFDPDKGVTIGSGIFTYFWDFGDGALGYTGPTIDKPTSFSSLGYANVGNYTVLLTVVDADTGYESISSQVISVSQLPFHELQIVAILLNENPSPQLNLGDKVRITVRILDTGTFDEIFNLTISYGPPDKLLPPPFTNQTIQPGTSHTRTFNATLDTSILSYGSWEVVASLVNVHIKPILTRALFTINEPSNVPYLPIAVGLAIIVAVPSTFLLFRRRRKEDIE